MDLIGPLKQNLVIENLFPIQKLVLPLVYAGRDVCVSAPTGSGKTLAYVIPILDKLYERVIPQLRALIVVPTRDLAFQVKKTFVQFNAPLNIILMTGSMDYHQEIQLIESADIIICTPGRLLDHLQQPHFSLVHLKYLVLDEVDRLVVQFQDFIPRLLSAIPTPIDPFEQNYGSILDPPPFVQKLVFSATLENQPEKLSVLQLYHPEFISMTEKVSIPTCLKEQILTIDISDKPLIIYTCLKQYKKVLIFVKSVEAAHRLAYLLNCMEPGCLAAISSDLSSNERKKLLDQFSKGSLSLVCSDVMARGIDLHVELVINYDIPVNTQAYIHRIGRTARAGRSGVAMTLLEFHQVKWFNSMMGSIERTEKITRLSLKELIGKDAFDQELVDAYEGALEKLAQNCE